MNVDLEHDRWTSAEPEKGYIRVRLRLTAAEQRGRRTPLNSGYRAHWGFPTDFHQENLDAPLTLEGARTLAPGGETIARLHPLVPELWPSIEPGLRLSMLEGSRLVGVADVIEVVPRTAL